jgi:hypothetical protein
MRWMQTRNLPHLCRHDFSKFAIYRAASWFNSARVLDFRLPGSTVTSTRGSATPSLMSLACTALSELRSRISERRVKHLLQTKRVNLACSYQGHVMATLAASAQVAPKVLGYALEKMCHNKISCGSQTLRKTQSFLFLNFPSPILSLANTALSAVLQTRLNLPAGDTRDTRLSFDQVSVATETIGANEDWGEGVEKRRSCPPPKCSRLMTMGP